MIDYAALDEKVERGALWYDGYDPAWFTKVTLDDLVLSNGMRCVVGQVEGGYYSGLNKFQRDGYYPETEAVTWESDRGFMVSCVDAGHGPDCPGVNHEASSWKEAWDYLTKAWTIQINNRLIAAER